jgi:hypothetical protein
MSQAEEEYHHQTAGPTAEQEALRTMETTVLDILIIIAIVVFLSAKVIRDG